MKGVSDAERRAERQDERSHRVARRSMLLEIDGWLSPQGQGGGLAGGCVAFLVSSRFLFHGVWLGRCSINKFFARFSVVEQLGQRRTTTVTTLLSPNCLTSV